MLFSVIFGACHLVTINMSLFGKFPGRCCVGVEEQQVGKATIKRIHSDPYWVATGVKVSPSFTNAISVNNCQ
jgi:hypothetical protein